MTLGEWIDALGGTSPVPAGGALALATLAGAAALASKIARLKGVGPDTLLESARFFLQAAKEDETAYAEALAFGDEAMERCLETGIEHLKRAVLLLEDLDGRFGELQPSVKADVAAAAGLARASARVLLVNLAVNTTEWSAKAANASEASVRLEEFRRRIETQ